MERLLGFDVANERVKSHAPFFVYGIRLVKTMGRA